MINRAQVIKLDPTKAQAIMMAKTVGAARYIWNWGLDKWLQMEANGEKCSAYILCHLWTIERPEWAPEVSAQCLQRPLLHLQGAFKAYKKGIRGKPKFRKRGTRDRAYFSNQAVKLLPNRRIYLPKIGNVRMKQDLRYEDYKLVSCTLKREADGWYVAIRVEIEEERRTESTTFVGVDVGCKHIAIASDGTICETPGKLKDIERQIVRRNKILARKQKGSNNRKKARNRLAKAYLKQRRVKHDAIHKFTAKIAKSHGVGCIESLDVKSMQSGDNKYVRKGTHNSAMSEVLRQLKYKCNNFIEVSQYFPSSKTCSNCGHIKAELPLSQRVYICEECGYAIERDLNAAVNLRNEGMRLYAVGHTVNACGNARESVSEAGIPCL